jgi:hypothetical protein
VAVAEAATMVNEPDLGQIIAHFGANPDPFFA